MAQGGRPIVLNHTFLKGGGGVYLGISVSRKSAKSLFTTQKSRCRIGQARPNRTRRKRKVASGTLSPQFYTALFSRGLQCCMRISFTHEATYVCVFFESRCNPDVLLRKSLPRINIVFIAFFAQRVNLIPIVDHTQTPQGTRLTTSREVSPSRAKKRQNDPSGF